MFSLQKNYLILLLLEEKLILIYHFPKFNKNLKIWPKLSFLLLLLLFFCIWHAICGMGESFKTENRKHFHFCKRTSHMAYMKFSNTYPWKKMSFLKCSMENRDHMPYVISHVVYEKLECTYKLYYKIKHLNRIIWNSTCENLASIQLI